MSETSKITAHNYNGPIPRTPIRFLWFISKPHKFWSIFSIVTTILAQVIGIVAVYAISQLIDGFTAASSKEAQLDALWTGGLIFLGLTIVERVLWRISGFTGIKWLVDLHATGFRQIFSYLTDHSNTYFINRFAGSISNKVSNAVDGGTRLLERLLWGAGPEIISLIATLYFFWLVHWSVFLVMLLVIVFVFSINVYIVSKRRPYVIEFSKASSKLRGEGVDMVTNISAVRLYSAKSAELSRMDLVITDQAVKDKRQWFMGEWLSVFNTLVALVLTAVVLGMVYVLLQKDMATAGNLVLVLMLLGRVSFIFATLGNMLNGFIRMYSETEEGLNDILVPYEILDKENATVLKVTDGGEITWDKVGFNFEGNPAAVFADFDLMIPAGQRVGLVGASGAGKSTFVSLLLRQHDVTAGAIMIDGQNIAEVTQDSLRNAIAVVPQEPALFHRSIRENIAYGKGNATQEEIEAVAKKAQAHDFITALPEGYDTLVGERGVKLSGGQKQRVAIARAMLKDAPILILDEATSALDSESEVEIQKALHILMNGKTVIAVAHRLSTLREMDRIIVLENGQIIEDGTHETLKDAGGTYAKLWNHQAGGFIID